MNRETTELDVIIVGAGAAGVGVGCVLRELKLERFALLERDQVGSSFRHWPREMRFLSPSFTSNAFGLLDLNAVALDTSPAYTLEEEHPTGRQYARYLQGVAKEFELPVRLGVEVEAIEPRPEGGFHLTTTVGRLSARFVVWAAGEFHYPRLDPFPGAELCVHNTRVRSWKELEGDNFVVIGGYESGIDAAVQLSASGRRVRVLDREEPWARDDEDPSLVLSPYTLGRLRKAFRTGRLQLIGEAEVVRVARSGGVFLVHGAAGGVWSTPVPPILATGFSGSLRRIAHLFEWSRPGFAQLTEDDESTRTPGLFVVGPHVRHDDLILCFIYKFRQRFAVVARAIAERLGVDTSPLERYRSSGMFLDDLSCCHDRCVC